MAINITGIPKANLLAALYNSSFQLGLGHMNPRGREELTVADAEVLLKERTHFDHRHIELMKVQLKHDEMDEWAYDRDNGSGSVQKVIDKLRLEFPLNGSDVA